MESINSKENSQCSGFLCGTSDTKNFLIVFVVVGLTLVVGYFIVKKLVTYLKSKNKSNHNKNLSTDGMDLQKRDKTQHSTYEVFADTLETKSDAINLESGKERNFLPENFDKITHFPTKLALKLQEYLIKSRTAENNDQDASEMDHDANTMQDNQMSDGTKSQTKDNDAHEIDLNNEIFYSEENGPGTVRVISDLASPKDQNLRDNDELKFYS